MAKVNGDYSSQIVKVASKNESSQIGKKDGAEQAEGADKKQSSDKGQTVFAGDLKLVQDEIGEKRAKASKDALKTIMDTFGAASKLDNEIAKRSEHIEQLDGEIMDNLNQIDGIRERKSELMDTYGIEADSEEEQDLALYQARSDAMEDGKRVNFTEEQQARLAAMDANGLSEYQSQAMELHKQERHFDSQIEDMRGAQKEDTGVINGIHKARLKEHDMIDSKKAADAIIENANREIFGMLVNEAKDSIDEKLDEAQEDADKKAEESDKNDKKTDNKDDINNNNTTTAGNTITNAAVQKDILQNEADRLLANKKATVEDLKGIEVDQLT